MNKYLLSALSLVALIQAASAADVAYTVTLEGGHEHAAPPELELKFYSAHHPMLSKSLETSKGTHILHKIPDGIYHTIEVVGAQGAMGFMDCTKSDGTKLTDIPLGRNHPLSLSIVVKQDKHYDWVVSSCEEMGG